MGRILACRNRNAARKLHLLFHTALAPNLGSVKADPGQVDQVLMNLAVNARDAMPRGGKLTLETANADLGDEYAAGHYPVLPGRYVMMAVSDTGEGIDERIRGHIFDPFFTTKEKGKGTGLGLSTVYGIVKQSGYIWVYSEPGKGTTFKIYLPRVGEARETIRHAGQAGETRGTETIPLVEDEVSLRKLTQQMLGTSLVYRLQVVLEGLK